MPSGVDGAGKGGGIGFDAHCFKITREVVIKPGGVGVEVSAGFYVAVGVVG